MLKDLAIKQFIQIYKDEFNEVLSDEEARIRAQKVFGFFKVIILEISKDEKVFHLNLKGGDQCGNKNQSQ